MKKQIPNIITLLNLAAGCIAIVNAFESNFTGVVIWVVVAAVLDFFDGLAARLLHAPSAIGKELDSLADLVSFGVAPAMTVFILLREYTLYPSFLLPAQALIPYLAFIIPMFSAFRLAKFNLDERQTLSFIGLPTPANGLFWICYVHGMQLIAPQQPHILYLTTGFIVVLSLLMVAEVPMFSLKIKKLSLRGNERQVILLCIMIAFFAIWGISGIAWGILAYIALSVTTHKLYHS